MDPITVIAVGIVLAGTALLVASAWSMATEKPAPKRISLELWCPAAAQLRRVHVSKSVDRRLSVLSCERFPDGNVECDRACIPAGLAA